MLKKIKAVIFDLDGVICSTDEYHYEAWKSIADSIGVLFDRTVNNRLRGISRMNSLEIILEQYPGQFSQAEKEALAEQKNELYKSLLMQMSRKDLSADTKAILETLRKAGYLLAIGSSSKNTPLILRQIGLEGFFDAVADGNQITHSKPAPEVFLLAAQLLGVKPEECLVVEDAVAGAQAAHAGNMLAACVGDASAAGAGDYNMCAVSQLVSVLKEIEG